VHRARSGVSPNDRLPGLPPVEPALGLYSRRVQQFLQIFIQFFLVALWLLILARVLLSWVNPRFDGTIPRWIHETTEPLLAPIRRVLPQTGMIDFSPLILLIAVGLLMRLVLLR
jgi:YggT family protein